MQPTNIADLTRWDREVGGWIAQDGTFFRAEFYEHDNVARRIVDSYFSEERVGSPSDWLEHRGWIRLETYGNIWHSIRPTEQQANVLYHLWLRADPSDYKDEMYNHIKVTVLEVLHAKEPMPRVPGQGDQENYHWTQAHRPGVARGVYA